LTTDYLELHNVGCTIKDWQTRLEQRKVEYVQKELKRLEGTQRYPRLAILRGVMKMLEPHELPDAEEIVHDKMKQARARNENSDRQQWECEHFESSEDEDEDMEL
jgi:hypothetical protein